MRVIPIQTYTNTKPTQPISFKSTSSDEASLSVQNPDKTQFKESMKAAMKADAVLTNPIEALVRKIGSAIAKFMRPRSTTSTQQYSDTQVNDLIDQIPALF